MGIFCEGRENLNHYSANILGNVTGGGGGFQAVGKNCLGSAVLNDGSCSISSLRYLRFPTRSHGINGTRARVHCRCCRFREIDGGTARAGEKNTEKRRNQYRRRRTQSRADEISWLRFSGNSISCRNGFAWYKTGRTKHRS